MPESDPLQTLLAKAPMSQQTRAQAWDAFNAAANEDELAEKLKAMPLPNSVRADLWDLKHQSAAAPAQQVAQAEVKPEESSLTLGNVLRGAEKGAVGTFVGLGELVHQIPGVTQAVDTLYGSPGISQQAFKEANRTVTPANTGESVGKTAEQIGEFFIPVTKAAGAGRFVGKIPEVVKAGVLGAAQSEGSPGMGLATAGLTAVLPGGGAAKRLASALDESAEKSVVQALGATKEGAKATARRIAPEMIERGVKGSRQAMYEQAAAESQAAGAKLGALYKQAGAAGETINGTAIQGELQLAREALMQTAANGKLIPIEGSQRVVYKLKKLEDFVAQMGSDIPVDKAAKIKTAWDRIVAKSGLYGPKAAASATDNADAWATREAAGALRTALQSANPDIAALSKEYAFWKGLRDVLSQTALRTQAQGGGLGRMIGTGTGASIGTTAAAAAGLGTGGLLTSAALAGTAGRGLVRLMQSPAWRTSVSAPLKSQLADALASGSVGAINSTTVRILSALPPQLRAQFAQ